MPRLGADNDTLRDLRARIDALNSIANRAMATANNAVAAPAKRFRVGIFTVPLTILGGQVSGSVKWSTPITDSLGTPVDDYNVDAACSAFPQTPLLPAYSAQSSAGVTVTFTAPVLLAAGTIVIVQAIAPAVASAVQGKA